ncbi:MAG: transposase [Parvularculaceae bacterium]|nr:transposase [Parvularculaceae bacterium]
MEIILGKERRRWSAAQKRAIGAETMAAGSVARVARRHGANPAMVFAWRKQLGASAVEAPPARVAPVELVAPIAMVESTAPLMTADRTEPKPSAAAALIDVEIGPDIRLRINAGADAAVAAAVAKALAQDLARR